MASSGFEDFCDGTFWNTTLLLDSSWPRFTNCFINTALVWLPCGFLFLMLPYYVTSVNDQQNRGTAFPITLINALKMFCSITLATLSFVQLLLRSSDDALTTSVAAYLGDALWLAAFILMAVMTQYERLHGAQSTAVPFFFWLFTVLCNIIPLYTFIMVQAYKKYLVTFSVFTLSYGLQVVSLVLTAFVDHGGNTAYSPMDQPPCPVTTCSYPSYLLFRWMTNLLMTGYRREVETTDLWQLPPAEQSDNVIHHFLPLWQEQLVKCQRINGTRKAKREAKVASSVHFYNTNRNDQSVVTNLNEKTRLVNKAKTNYESTNVDEDEKVKPNLLWVLAKLHSKNFFICFTKKIFSDLLFLSTAVLLGVLLSHLSKRNRANQPVDWKCCVLCVAMFLAIVIKSILFTHSMFGSTKIGIRMKSSLVAAINEKALNMTNSSRGQWTLGEVVNMVSVDCHRIQDTMDILFFVVTTPIQLVVAIALLYVTLGPSIFVGVVVILVGMSASTYIVTKQKALQMKSLNYKDARTKLYSEILNGIKVLKLYAWEPSFREKIREIRLKEVGVMLKLAITNICMSLFWDMAPYLVTFATFATYLLSDPSQHLDVPLVFVTLALFNIIRAPLNMMPTLIMYIIQARVSIKRINDFLSLDELDPDAVSRDCSEEYDISIQNGTFTWDKITQPVLTRINLNVGKGLLVAVVGPVGCGKSSLISAILGEMEKIEGRVSSKGSVAYVPQQAWIQNASVQNNILFGKRLKRNKYNSVVAACELECDLEVLEAGDLTEIGERGINLSGGQKQRVSVARAVYSDSDVYLLDDPLSAVDSRVGKAIFNNVIGPKGLLKEKTRVLVTHGVHWLPMVDEVIVMADGKISERGTYEQLMSRDGPFAQFLKVHLKEVRDSDDEMDPGVAKIREEMAIRVDSATSDNHSSGDEQAAGRRLGKRERKKEKQKREETSSIAPAFDPIQGAETIKKAAGGELVAMETVEKGKVKKSTVKDYIKASGMGWLALAFFCFCGYQAFSLFSNIWLKIWSNDPDLYNASIFNLAHLESGNRYHLAVFGSTGVAQFLCLLAFNCLYWTRMVNGAKVIHVRLADRIMRAPMGFFDTTPTGRILNRVSRDVEVIDNTLPMIIREFSVTAALVLVTLIVVVSLSPITIAIVIPVVVLYYFVQGIFVPTARQLKRLESVSRSPILAILSETISGAASIRAYGQSARFVSNMNSMVDTNQVYYFAAQAAMRWLQFNLDLLSATLVLAAGLFIIVGSSPDSGDVGLSLSYALQVSAIVTWMTRQICEFETNIVSVERLKEYSELKTEAEWNLPEKRPPSTWPEAGEVTFDNYQTRYREGLDLVLKGVTCTIKPGEKVGIVGRTGAGKSSLTLSLFRLIESAGGSIYIDSVNIADMGLHDLRNRLTILPQDPVMFSGTLRMNLDPFGEYSDSHLWQALDRAHLRVAVMNMSDKLNFQCGEEGSNLSVGQRQLVCLARSLLRKTKILVLDEATAAVDMETDVIIQSTIRSDFADCTIITIAHRLSTILDYDRIMLMDSGVVVQFAPPAEMLSNPDSPFHAMARDAGLV